LTYNTDKFAFETIISNLIENALKYAGLSAEIIINCALENNRLKIEFSDNGPGVPENKLQSIFERFVRLENEDTRNSKGTGLGLYIVDQFVKGQHGSITAENTQPSGLKFTIHL
jgi:K+-sensing histidine kinase KdpD